MRGKVLKGLLEECQTSAPHSHNLKDLLVKLIPHHKSLGRLKRGLVFLTRFAVGTRYPGDNASKRQATSALRWAKKVREACRDILHLPGS
ncbi:MAG: HEPN domain-containing protein [Planctomycetes bacterium]|nr:HEPN domain-containing protein [Planctomycetota bacterium]